MHPLVLEPASFLHEVQRPEELVPKTPAKLMLGCHFGFQVIANGPGSIYQDVVINKGIRLSGL
jgi:hypothetical protein